VTCYIAGVDMKVIITFTFCCDNLWKSKFMALEKPGNLRDFFLLLCGHPVIFPGQAIKIWDCPDKIGTNGHLIQISPYPL